MNRIKPIMIILFLFGCGSIYAQNGAINGFCVKGATPATTSGLNSTNALQGVVPGGPAGCLVTVYLTGTVTPATIYSNAAGGTLTNPFRASLSGQWLFYAAESGQYDVVLSGGLPPNNYTTPITLTGVSAGGGGNGCPAGTNGQLQANNAGACEGIPADWNVSYPGFFTFDDAIDTLVVNPTYVPYLSFSGGNYYSATVDYLTLTSLTNDRGGGAYASVKGLEYQGFFPGWDYGNVQAFGFTEEVMNTYDYTDAVKEVLQFNIRSFGGDDLTVIDQQEFVANTGLFGSAQGDTNYGTQRIEQGWGSGPYTNTVATGGGGAGATHLTLVTTGGNSYNPFGPHRPLIDKTSGVVTTTLSGIASYALGNGLTVLSATSSTTLTPSSWGTLASTITVPSLTGTVGNNTLKLSNFSVTFTVNITSGAAPTTASNCRIISHSGPGVDWIKPTVVTGSSNPYTITVTATSTQPGMFYGHSIGDSMTCDGTAGFLLESAYNYNYFGQHPYLLEIYGVTAGGLIVYGIQTPQGPQGTFGQSGSLAATIYQGGEIYGSIDPASGNADGGQLFIMPNKAAFANGDMIEVDNYLEAQYTYQSDQENASNPFAPFYGYTRIINGTAGILNGYSVEFSETNGLPLSYYVSGGGAGLARPVGVWLGIWGGGMQNFQFWPSNDAPGGNIPNTDGCQRGVLAACAANFTNGTNIGRGIVLQLPGQGGELDYEQDTGNVGLWDYTNNGGFASIGKYTAFEGGDLEGHTTPPFYLGSFYNLPTFGSTISVATPGNIIPIIVNGLEQPQSAGIDWGVFGGGGYTPNVSIYSPAAGEIQIIAGLLTGLENALGTCTTAATIPLTANWQTMTLTASDSCALTFTQPAQGTSSVTLQITMATGAGLSGGHWSTGTGFTTSPPTIAATSGSVFFAACKLDGTTSWCALVQ